MTTKPTTPLFLVPARSAIIAARSKCVFMMCCILLLLSFSTRMYGQRAQTGAIDDAQVATGGKLEVWAVPAEQKVRPDHRTETNNLVWTKSEKKIKVAGAGNEHVPFQVVITVPVPENRGPAAKGFFIEASPLSAGQGKSIGKEQIKFYLQHFILLDAKSSPVGDTGYWPDGLAPIQEPFGMDAQYSVVKNRPIWVDLTIPKGTPAGLYKGQIKVSQNGKVIETLNLEVEVYNFSLTDETPLITYINVSRSWLAGFYNKPSDSKEIDDLTQAYYDFLYKNRMEPWFNDMLLPKIEVSGKNIKVTFDDAKYKYYMNDLKTKRVLLNAFPRNLEEHVTEEPFSKEFNEKVRSYLSQIEKYFSKNGWKDRLVFNSPIDEPRTHEDYELTRKWADLVHKAAGDVAFLTTRTPVPVKEHPEWGTLRGYVDNFSIHGNHMNDPEVKRVIREEQAKGGEMTWYISCDQRYPQPNYFIDAPALDLVMVPWITERYAMDGILYWAVNFWSQTEDPWLDAGTFHSGFLCSGGWVLNGEGSVVYPGDRVKRYTGQPNIQGPVSSIRFELLREGIEDHVVLSMLKKSGNEAFAQQHVNDLVVDVSAFSRNLKDLYLARQEMARRLEGLNN